MWLGKYKFENFNFYASFKEEYKKNTGKISPSLCCITFFIRFHEKVLDEIDIDLVSSDEKKEEEEPLKKKRGTIFFRVDKLKWNR